MKKTLLFFLFILNGFYMAAQRESKTLNEGWRFYPDTAPDKAELINLPHTWNTDAYVRKDYHKGIGTYEKDFYIPAEWNDRQLFVTFEGANKYAGVYVNGEFAGEHKGGYTAFTLDITPFCHKEKNTLKVMVDNSRADVLPISGDFTFFGGIYRDVWLTAVPRQHFQLKDCGSKGIYVDIPEVSEENAEWCVRGTVENHADEQKSLTVENILYDQKGNTVCSTRKNITAKANESIGFAVRPAPVAHPELWSPEHPVLYRLETILKDRKTGKTVDKVTNQIGFRWFRFDANEGFFLNGKPYKLNGVCRHQDQKPVGTALSDEMHRRDLRMIKDMGANFIRISHYPQDPAVLEQCDKLGLLAWEEIPIIDIVPDTEGYEASCEQSLREMIRQHYNHPSIIMWGYMNEVMLLTYGQYKGEEFRTITERTLKLAKKLNRIAKEEDPYRHTTTAFHSTNIYNETGFGEITDIIGWNLYQGWYSQKLTDFEAYIDDQHNRYPNQVLMISEYGAGSDSRLHTLSPKAFDFSMEYQQAYLEHYLPEIAKRKYLSGHSYWNFIDFSSAQRDESMPRINNKGLVFADRTPKDVYYYFKAVNRKDIPVLHIATRDWTRRSGIQKDNAPVVQPVKVYTNLPEVEFFIDGKSLGTQKTENCHAIFNVPFTAGTRQLNAKGTGEHAAEEDHIAIEFDAIPYYMKDMRTEMAVNVGSNCFYTDEFSRLTWVPDQEYTPGSWGYVPGEGCTPRITRTEIKGTHNGPLFQSSLCDLKAYRFDVPEGTYEVELYFADTYQKETLLPYLLSKESGKESNDNIFDILINGRPAESGFSPCTQFGDFRALSKRYLVEAGNDGIEIVFKALNGHTFLNAIKIRNVY